MIKTMANLPTKIIQSFDPYLLLSSLDRSKRRLDTEIKPLSKKKIRDIDIGKKKEFDKLMKEYEELYEWKKAQEEKYKAKIKDSAKRPGLPNEGATMCFKRSKDPLLHE